VYIILELFSIGLLAMSWKGFLYSLNGYNRCVWDGASLGVRLVDAAIVSYLEA
jgi:hypothetical protein